ncbi:PREDICTED: F-box/FBD/LRR-repeat protein At1g13570-like [Nicotiana attenuata]|uniref:F-box/FBD/LRR-repeat protein At1g13570-like n=1 Tax=Nicotiana attenuata TaxID=49451 RepID=UPI000905D8AE|nr:PREDICTED: F-box/FBD/LRR-repeat protein At1g13570-like [Nicotiana attenuata]
MAISIFFDIRSWFLLANIYMMPPKGKRQYHCQILPLDMLSSLPENVIDDILVRLPLRDVVRTSILSKKWRYNWCRLPELALDQTLWITKKDLMYFAHKFTKIVTHFMRFHDGAITKFTLFIPYLERSPNIDKLIRFLRRNGIRHLALRLPIRGNPYELPPSFFTCFELRHLTLQNLLIIPPPAFRGFDRLISLELRDVTISSKLLESLISHCLLLEQLVLQISSALRDVIGINGPMLRSFDFTGSMSSICLKSTPLLAKLSLTHMEYYVAARKSNIAEFFESFSAIEYLHLNDMEQVKYQQGFRLILTVSNIFAYLVFFWVAGMRLHALFVERDDNDIPALECLDVERFSDVSFNHLREVKLIQTNGTIPEMQLMKLLLAMSPGLERMLIEPCLVEDSANVRILAELTKFQRASPEAEVVYKLDKHRYYDHPV